MSDATILLLPGNMCDARLWNPVGEHLRDAGIATSVEQLGSETTISSMAAALLDRHAGSLILIGFSMGAIVATTMAAMHPQRVRALGLLAFNASADLPNRAAVRPRQQRAALEGELGAIVADELKPAYLAAANRDDVALRSILMAMALDLGPAAFVAQSEALRTRGDLRPDLPRFTMPMLLATGVEDRLCPPEWQWQWAEMIGGSATVAIIAGAGHMLPLEQPERTAATIAAWLKEKVL